MRQVNLYKYVGTNGTIVSLVELPMQHEPMFRLIADEGKELKNGDTTAPCVDVYPNEVENWTEVDKSVEDNHEPHSSEEQV